MASENPWEDYAAPSGAVPASGGPWEDFKGNGQGNVPAIRVADVMRAPSLGDVVGASLANNRDIDAAKIAQVDLGKSVGDTLNAPSLTPVEAPEALGRGFVTGGGRLLQTAGTLASALLPAPGMSPLASEVAPTDKRIGSPLNQLGDTAVLSQAIQPNEQLSGLGAKVAFQGAELVPQLAAAIGTGGGASLEGLVPAAVRSVPVVGTALGGVAAGAPTATALNVEQLATAPDDASLGDFAKSAALNYALAGVPPAFGNGQIARTLTGGAVGGGLAAGSNVLEGKPIDPAGTIVGALTGAALAGGHAGPEKLDPYLERYEATKSTPDLNGPLSLPAPEAPTAAATEATGPIAPVAPAKFDATATAKAFTDNPTAALASLDHPTITQLASDVGLDVKPTDTPQAIAQKIAAQPKDFLQSDVLPEYLAAAQDAHNALQAVAPAPDAGITAEPPVPGLGDVARSLSPSSTVPVDSQGVAYTPEQGAKTLGDAIQAQAGSATRALPPAVTTVDSAGVATNSEAQNRQIAKRLADEQAGIEAAKAKRELGITPDIERTQGPRWEQLATNADDLRAMQDARDAQDDEVVGQRTDDAPEWWVAGQHAGDEFDQHMVDLQQARDQLSQQDQKAAGDVLTQHGIEPQDHDEALAISQLVERAYDAGATPHQILGAGQEPDNASRARALWALTNRLEGERNAQQPEVQQAGALGDTAQDQGIAAAGRTQPESAAGSGEAESARTVTVPERAGRGAGRVTALDHGELNTPLSKRGITDAQIDRELRRQQGERETQTRDARQRGKDVATEAKQLLDQIPKSRLKELGKPHGLSAKETRQEFLRSASTRPDTTLNTLRKEAAKFSGRVEESGPSVSDSAKPGELDTFTPPKDRRADWSPQLEGRAITAVDALVERYGGSTLADSIRDDLRETSAAQLIGQTVKSPEDLAAIASVYRNPAFETMRYVYVDRAGTVLGETAVSSRMPSTSVAFPEGAHDGTAWVMQSAPEGATGIWLIHNHPSGNPKASQADIDFTGTLSIKLGDTAGAPKLQGHVILDHDTYGHIDALGDFQGVKKIAGRAGTPDPVRSYKGDASMFDVPVTSPEFAAVTGKKIAAATPENSSAIVVMDAQGRVASVHTFPNDFLTTPRGAAMVSRLGGKRGAVGIGLVTSKANFIAHKDAYAKGALRGLLRDATVVDNDGNALSLGGTKALPNEYRKNFGQQSAATKRRAETGVQVREDAAGSSAPISLQAVRRALEARGVSPDAIAAMSRDELRAEQANLRARSEPTPQQQEALKTTGINNATKEEERAMAGKAAVEHDLQQSNPEQYARAKASFDEDPHAGQILAAKVIANPKTITPEDSILLSLDAMRIINARQSAYEQAEKAQASGDMATKVAAQSLIKQLDGQMEANDIAARYSGTKAGQALQARKVMIQQDYSMARMMLRAKVAKGEPLTDAERSKVEAASAEIAKRTAELDAREAKLRAMEAEARPAQVKRQARAKFDDLVAQLKAIPKKDHLKEGCIV
jgi:hypothetical protein